MRSPILWAAVLAICVFEATAECLQCKDCSGNDLLFTGIDGGPEISVFTRVINYVMYNCSFLESVNERYPGLKITVVDRATLVPEGASYDSQFSVYSDLMQVEDTRLEIVDWDIPWIEAMGDQLVPIPETIISNTRERFMTRRYDGEVVSLVSEPSTYYLFYRKDLFELHDIPYDTTSWDAWTDCVMALQKAEQERLKDPSWRAIHMPAVAGANTVYTVLLSLFLSGENAGEVVESNGTISINTPRAVKALKMIQFWEENLLHPESWTPEFFGGSLLWNATHPGAAFCFEWSWWFTWGIPSTPYSIDNKDYSVTVVPSPTPGPHGSGINGNYEVAVTKHTRMPDLAFEFVNCMSWQHIKFPMAKWHWWNNGEKNRITEPIRRETIEDPILRKSYCESNVMLCTAMTENPEFWEKSLASRPSRGCGGLLDRCQVVVAEGWHSLLTGSQTAQQVANDMEKELSKLLNPTVGQTLPATESDALTSEFVGVIAMLIVSVVLLLVLFGFMFRRISGLRKPRFITLPISVVLGVTLLSLFGIIQVVSTSQWNTSFREVSHDLGYRMHLSSSRALQAQLETLTQNWFELELLTVRAVRSLVKAKFIELLPGIELDERSLMLLIDRDGLENGPMVLSSSDLAKQPDDALLSDPNSGNISIWTLAALGLLGESLTKGSIRDGEIDEVSIGSTTALVTMRSFSTERFVNLYGTGGAELFELRFVLVYFVPTTVIFDEADKSLERAINTSVILSIAGVLILVCWSTVLTLPLIRLANDMEAVRAMRMETIKTDRSSRLTELASLWMGYNAMCEMLLEYKSFMPKTLFNNVDDDTSDTSTHDKTSISQHSHSLTHTFTDGTTNTRNVVQVGKMQVGVGMSTHTRGTLLSVSMLESATSTSSFEVMLSAVERSLGTGVLHSFNALRPGELIASWGLVGQPSNGRVLTEKAANAALEIRRLCTDSRIAIAALSGKFAAGNIGNKKTRGFAVVGHTVGALASLVESSEALTRAFNQTVIVAHSDFARHPGYDFRLVDSFVHDGVFCPIKEILARIEVAEQEWMYQLQEMSESKNLFVYREHLAKYIAALPKASEEISSFLSTEDEETDDSLVMHKLRALLDPKEIANEHTLCGLISKNCIKRASRSSVDGGDADTKENGP